MKNAFLFILICVCKSALSQGVPPPLETIGNPSVSSSVNSYNGWTNQGVLHYTGSAEVQNLNPSNTLSSSGGGNVFFTNTLGIFLQLDKFPTVTNNPNVVTLGFMMFGYDILQPNNLNELNVFASADSGITWTSLSYYRFFHLLPSTNPPLPWDYFSCSIPGVIEVNKLQIKFVQNSSTKTFRIDDISIGYIYLLNLKCTNFSAINNFGKTKLTWVGTSTNENDLFILERSFDGIKFSSISQHYTKGNGSYSYELFDNNYLKCFYRLKMKNENNKITYSNIISSSPEKKPFVLINSIHPLPANNKFYLEIDNAFNGNLNFSIVDINGRIVQSKNLILKKGVEKYEVDIQGLNSGIYYLKYNFLNVSHSKKLIVVK